LAAVAACVEKDLHVMRLTTLALAGAFALLGHAAPALAGEPDAKNWDAVLAAARGQTVYFNAWGGDTQINDYIAWAGTEVEKRFGVKVTHVKLNDTADAVNRVLAEKAAGTTQGGSVDLIWINGANFASMKSKGLLLGDGWGEAVPSFTFADADKNPSVRSDFTVPVEGQEVPWGKAQLVFAYDTAVLKDPPKSVAAMLAWAKANPGRFTYPLPPDFTGTTFLKQALLDLAADKAPLNGPAGSADFAKVTAPLWAYLDQLHPLLWHQGKTFPANYPEMRHLLADNEVSISFAFNPSDASSGIAKGELPKTVRTYVLDGGTIGNVHFVAIPFNAKAKAGAMVLANFLLSPEAQARKADPAVWGDPSVLAIGSLAAEDRARFDALTLGVATLKPAELGAPVPEPHPSWVDALVKEWQKRYAAN
jgi:putative thiamine transport system substrate-binding protein